MAGRFDLLRRPGAYLALHAALCASMLLAWRHAARAPAALRWIFAGALLFRLVAVFAPPTLSDDLYRYVWDGRVQADGVHPYAHAPDDPALAGLRDADWERINHPELRTIYPPGAELLFAALAGLGAGTTGFKLAFALADCGAIAALAWLLRRTGLPPDRVVLYAWNPLAVLETAGSGHVEPVGVALVLLFAVCMAERRKAWAAVALAIATHVKLLPAVLIPGAVRRMRNPAVLLLAALLVALALPYALRGPAVGEGLFAYAERWERNALVYRGVEELLERADTGNALKPAVASLARRWGGDGAFWNEVYARVWPRELARLAVALAALGWVVALSFRRGLDGTREVFLALAGVLLLSPTLHPWYVLWVLPFAAAFLSVPWLLFAALVPLSYVGAAAGQDVPWSLRAVEYGVPLAAGIVLAARRRGR